MNEPPSAFIGSQGGSFMGLGLGSQNPITRAISEPIRPFTVDQDPNSPPVPAMSLSRGNSFVRPFLFLFFLLLRKLKTSLCLMR